LSFIPVSNFIISVQKIGGSKKLLNYIYFYTSETVWESVL